jgi:ABC-type bacteriocin/lantibiotic exporter with double-glycine peptidase domain
MKKNLIVLQEGVKECGSAVLLSIIRYYGGNISVNVDSEFNSSSQNPVTNQFLTNFFTAMTQAQYDALSTKTLPLYFVYEM